VDVQKQIWGGQTWIDYLLDRNTFDSDLEMVDEMHWTASYPDLTWMFVEPAHLVWDEEVWRYYRYTYQQLREHGVDRVLIKIQYTPKWASTNPTASDFSSYPPTCDCYWTEFIKAVAARLGDVVDDYAIMNEVNLDGFWKGTQDEYMRLEREAYDTIKQYDTIDADGDGVPAFVAPSSSNEPTQYDQWVEWYTGLYPKMDAFHTHDYKWGIKPGADQIQSIDPSLQYVISETGPANWFINQRAVPQYNPAAMASAIGYLLKDPSSPVDFLTQWLLRGDPDKDAPWPNSTEWLNSEPDPYANNDGYTEDFNSSLVNVEPPGPPYTNWTFTSSGAYVQHWGWVFDMDGTQVPVEVASTNPDIQYEVDAVDLGNRIEVIATNFAGGLDPLPASITVTLRTPWTSVDVDAYDPAHFTGTSTSTGPYVTLTAPNLGLDSVRWVLSDGAAPQDATPGVFIATPAKSATVTGSVTIAADAFDDGSVSTVEYRIDPIDDGPFVPMTPQSGGRYTATWDSSSAVAPGDHTIQVRVTADTGKTGTASHVVKVT
jgi:Bacterial Ig domain